VRLRASCAARRGSRRRAAGVLVMGFFLSACGGGGGGAGEKPVSRGEPRRGGTLISAESADFDALNPLVSTDFDTNECMRFLLFMTLTQYGEDMELQPYLAESWELAPDGLSLTYHLRKDVTWHDGTPTTADDVKFTYERSIDPKVAFANVATYQYYKSAEVLDRYTIRFTFTKPFAEQVEGMTLLPIVPKHLLEKVPPEQIKNAAFNRNPVGNGPYKFVRWKANEEIVLEANDAFSPTLGGRPYIDRVVFRVIPEQTTQVTMLLTGQLDLMRAVPPQDGKRVEASDRARLVTYPNRAYTFIAWNERLPMFKTAKERTALTLAVDRKAMVDALLYGYGEVAVSHSFSTSWARDPSIQPLPYDPEKAKQLLAEEGWRDTNGDGILDRDGKKFEFDLVTNKGNDIRADNTVMVKSDLAKIGVVARPVLREWTVLLEEVERKEYQAWLSGWVVDFTYDPRDLFHSEAIEGKYNMVSFSNPKADSLIDLGTSLTSREEAKPVWAEFQRLLAEEQPYTFLYLLKERVGISRRVQGVKGMDARSHIFGLRHWWIES
jgi:peptide/nickel transport system substrate-binding protein